MIKAQLPTSTAKLQRRALADDMKQGLVRYHQLDGLKNGSRLEGVQFNPIVAASEKALRKELDGVVKHLSSQDNFAFRPSPSFEPGRGEFRADLAAKSAKMVESSAKQMLAEATNLIHDPTLKAMVKEGLKTVPKQFYSAPSSSTGQFHPADEINKGGLVLHTCRVVETAQHLADYYEISPKERDIVTAALILHDSCKGGKPWVDYAKDHGDVAAAHIATLKNGNSAAGKVAQRLAANHMAQWTQLADGTRQPRPPADKLEQIVSYADYIAAQDNIYISPRGYNANYLDEVPLHEAPAPNQPDYLKFFTSGNKITPLADSSVTPKDESDDIFHQIRESISGAKKSIQVEMFGLGQEEIVDLLIAKKKEGLDVQVVLDPVNEDYEKEKAVSAKKLQKAGVEVLFYPIREADEQNRFAQINHVKMLIIDGDEAIIGGMNWGSHSHNNHDVDVRIQGPLVDRMEKLFNKDYEKSGGKSPLPIEKTPVHPEGNSLASLATSSDDPKERQIKATLHRAIREAKESIQCELFFLTDWSLTKALVEAKERGVDVKVLLNPSEIDGNRLNEKSAETLKKAGVEVKWFVPDEKTGSKLHAKMGVFDGQEVILGSANWSGNGLQWNREANVDVIDKDVAGFYSKMFKRDFPKGSAEPVYGNA